MDKAPKSGPEFVQLYFPEDNLCLIPFESSVESGQLVTMEKKGERLYASNKEYVMYLESRNELIKRGGLLAAVASESKDAMMKFSSIEEPIHIGKTALYSTDFEIDVCPNLLGVFMEGLDESVKKMLPSL